MSKSPDAFRTISEVAEALDTPSHVLRFWETRFPQIRPVKRAGGRRYYRPTDVALLSGIKRLLHEEGLTIRGVQKILREQGVRHVVSLASNGEVLDEAAMLAAEMAALRGDDDEPMDAESAETAQVIALQSALDPARPRPKIEPALPPAGPLPDLAHDPVPEAPMDEWAEPASAEITPLPRSTGAIKRDESDTAPRAESFQVTRISDDPARPLSVTERNLSAPAQDSRDIGAKAEEPAETAPTLASRLRRSHRRDEQSRALATRILARAIQLRDHLANPPQGPKGGRA